MANLNIQVIAPPATEYVDKGNGKGYNKLTVTYKNLATGKVEVKSVMDFANKEVYERLARASQNDTFAVTSEKINNFWNWTEVHRDDSPPPATTVSVGGTTSGPGPKVNTYEEKNKLDRERFEFEKSKQQLIIRQSCLSVAATVGVANKMGSDAILTVAEQFVDWVNKDGMQFMTDDIPE